MNKLYIKKFYNKMNEINDENFILYYKSYLPENFSFTNFSVLGELNNLYNMFCTIHIESKYCTCYLCKKNIDYEKNLLLIKIFKKYYNKINTDLLLKIEKLIKNNNRIFSYELEINQSMKIYFNYYYHLCKDCYENSLYYFYKIYNYYPKNNLDGNYLIKYNKKIVPDLILNEDKYIINNKKIPKFYRCDKYSEKIYNF